jgi:nucleoside-diphosphate-sugar epimerase
VKTISERRKPNIDKRRKVRWEPTVTPEDGLRRTIVWYRAELERLDSWLPSPAI